MHSYDTIQKIQGGLKSRGTNATVQPAPTTSNQDRSVGNELIASFQQLELHSSPDGDLVSSDVPGISESNQPPLIGVQSRLRSRPAITEYFEARTPGRTPRNTRRRQPATPVTIEAHASINLNENSSAPTEENNVDTSEPQPDRTHTRVITVPYSPDMKTLLNYIGTPIRQSRVG